MDSDFVGKYVRYDQYLMSFFNALIPFIFLHPRILCSFPKRALRTLQ